MNISTDRENLEGELAETFPPTEDEVAMEASEDEEPGQDDVEVEQEEEKLAGLESDDEEWGEELTGERVDNGFLPGQRMAEIGIDREIFPEPSTGAL